MSIDAIRKRWAGVGPWRSRSSWYTHRWEVVSGYDVAATDSPVLADIIASAPDDIRTLLAAIDAVDTDNNHLFGNLGEALATCTKLTAERDAALVRVQALEAALAGRDAPGDMALDDWYKGRPERGGE